MIQHYSEPVFSCYKKLTSEWYFFKCSIPKPCVPRRPLNVRLRRTGKNWRGWRFSSTWGGSSRMMMPTPRPCDQIWGKHLGAGLGSCAWGVWCLVRWSKSCNCKEAQYDQVQGHCKEIGGNVSGTPSPFKGRWAQDFAKKTAADLEPICLAEIFPLFWELEAFLQCRKGSLCSMARVLVLGRRFGWTVVRWSRGGEGLQPQPIPNPFLLETKLRTDCESLLLPLC